MAINVNESINTPLGVNLSSLYIRLEINDLFNGTLCVKYHAYSSKAEYSSGASSINKHLTGVDLSHYNNGILSDANHNRNHIHDLAITELLSRHSGWSQANLSKVDLA